jgi:glycosyltransferase involved in cell wall biosynthesis
LVRLIYLANARLPTEKAHGRQIVKMCEAFSHGGATVELLYPRRRQPGGFKGSRDIHGYYGVERIFDARETPNIDVLRVTRHLPALAELGAANIQAVAWGYSAAHRAAREHADLYYTREVPLASWLSRLRVPTVLELHAMPGTRDAAMIRRVASKKHLRAVVLTKFIRGALIKLGIPGSSIVVEPDGFDPRSFQDMPARSQARDQLGLPTDGSIIGHAGELLQMGVEKGISELMMAMEFVIRSHPTELICVGGPDDAADRYRSKARGTETLAGAVKFIGRVPPSHVPIWLKAFDVAVIPLPDLPHYRWAASPLKLFEYMAAGVPIVASRLPSLEEVLVDRRNALLARPGDPVDLATQILNVLEDGQLAHRLSSAALQDVRSYTWDARAARILRENAPIHSAPGSGS